MSMMCRLKWPFLLMYVFHDVRHVEFRGLTGSQRTPRVLGVTAWYQSEGKRLPWELGGCRYKFSLDTSFTAWYQSVGIQYLGLDWKRVRSCIHFALMNGVYNMLVICTLYEIVCLVNSIGEIVEHYG